ncbi:hypothetical protein E4U58_001231 [Claviceps cyperi]|nr:hypothetical protein E4U58_001231 [Claviceps cyperi]
MIHLPEACSEELEDGGELNKRAYLFRRVVEIPKISHGAKPPTPTSVELYGVRFMFLMEEWQTVLRKRTAVGVVLQCDPLQQLGLYSTFGHHENNSRAVDPFSVSLAITAPDLL